MYHKTPSSARILHISRVRNLYFVNDPHCMKSKPATSVDGRNGCRLCTYEYICRQMLVATCVVTYVFVLHVTFNICANGSPFGIYLL